MLKTRHFFLFLYVLLVQFVNAQGKVYTVQTIPDPKLAPSRTTVSDPDNYIDEAAEASINAITWDLEQKADVQFGIVIVNSVGSDEARQFASKLFNYWKIGQAGKDNGLLLMIVLDQKRWEFETGLGLEEDLTDYECVQLGKAYLVPYFKQQDYQAGILNVVNAVRKDLFMKKGIALTDSTGAALHEPVYEDPLSDNYSSTSESEPLYTDEELKSFRRADIIGYGFTFLIPWFVLIGIWAYRAYRKKKELSYKLDFRRPNIILFILNALIPVATVVYLAMNVELFGWMEAYMLVSLYIALALLVFGYRHRLNRAVLHPREILKERDVYETYSELRASNKYWTLFAPIILPFPFIPYLVWYYLKCSKLRRADRPCKNCSNTMHYTQNVIEELLDDKYLQPGQIKEEQLTSRDWDVWLCKSCSHVEVLGYKAYFTSYTKCPACTFIAEVYEGSETITAATYSSSGTGKRKYRCKNCNNYREEQYTIAQLQRSSGGSGGSSWSSGGSGGGGGGGGSSWGGGRSGGGGGGGSW